MLRLRNFLPLAAVLAGAGILGVPATSRADLLIRVTSLNNAGTTTLGSATDTVVLSDPMPALSSQSKTFSGLAGGFDVTIASNLSTTGSGTTDHSLTINVTYSGPNGVGVSNQLIVEFLGTNYVTPVSPPNAFIQSNASPSTAGLKASMVTMVSGVSVTNAGLPGTAGSTAGLSGLTTGTGTMGSASSVLMPNPVTGAQFAQSGAKFSFYQAFTFNDLSYSGVRATGSVSAGSFVTNIPAPPTLVAGLLALPFLGLGGLLRRRKKVQPA